MSSQSNPPLTLGQKIIQSRRNLDMTVAELSKATGLSACDIELIENGFRLPRLTVLARIANGLNVNMANLVCEFQKQLLEQEHLEEAD